MITILGGDIICALGDKQQRLQHLENGTYETVEKQMDVFGEMRSYPYYQLAGRPVLPEYFDPIPIIIPLIQTLIDKHEIDADALGRCGLFLGCSANDLSISHSIWLNAKDSTSVEFDEKRVGNGVYATRLIEHFGLNELSLTYNTACTSSANAALDAATMLEANVIDYALVIGLETFASLSFEGFASMQLLADDQVSPFSKDRQGMVLGESLAALFMSRDDVCESSWKYRGGVNRSEIASVTGAKLDGSGIKEVIDLTLASCQLQAGQITSIKTHGTGSPMGDLAEIRGMQSVFEQQPDFFSFKPFIGHTLGSCGVSEMLLLIECVDQGFIPGTPNFENIDPDLRWAPMEKSKSCEAGNFLLNYFGFGGNNVSMVVEKVAL
ncbi:beta-ketoacyl synthase N-terminal-like domain-containing protein [Granulosicoccus antarcticus]|uniref:3-oxoacyl-[acyl-carrier-protein] synthase 2 n=1 Tax=Granulosicoccus antarcticus IMCC3135 TaxID=1192854 RepID=A0A2Z2NNG4_9GAMM|nr:beta-ketoacyl synthase N-terminal-like domain-containing protein [Granulosicoccus antarcticus]ASJ72769.1 3-oxoacyl-[acyl-carrier-protein] synthase 2 [Granulosicoccus antarcticus IMCC3135]